jgi:large conductance mechanosensitive channel
MALLEDFKKFVLRGNVVDLAIGVIIGVAFGKITTSLVNDIIMPPVGYALGGVDFSHLQYTIKEATATTPAVTIKYGAFISTIIDFLLIAIACFALMKMITFFMAQKEAEPTEKKCPECLMAIPIQATKCGHCCSDLKNP